jgi:hypothetical protein
MKNRYIVIGLLLSLNIFQSSAQAQETSLQVQSWCKFVDNLEISPADEIAIPNTFSAQFCWGAFGAIQQLIYIVDWNNESKTGSGKPMLGVCAPQGSDRVQYIKIFMRYADRHPEQGHIEFAGVARRALADAFPCRPPNWPPN